MKSTTPRPSLGKDLTELLTLAWPVVISRIGFMTMGLIDTLVVARYSTEQLGFHALAWAISGVVMATGFGLLSGVQVMTARHRGEGRPEATGGVLRRGTVYAFWIGLAALLGFFPAMAGGAAKWAVLRWPSLGGRYGRLLLLAIACNSGRMIVLQLATGKIAWELSIPTGCLDTDFHPDGKSVLVSDDANLVAYDRITGKPVSVLKKHAPRGSLTR